MAIAVKREVLTALCKLLREHARPITSPKTLTGFERQLLEGRMTTICPLGDHLISSERRGYGAIEHLIEDLLDPLEIPRQWVYAAPEFPEDEVSGFPGLTAVDVVGLLIKLEHLGIQVDPRNLVAKLSRGLKNKRLVLYKQNRGKQQVILGADREDAETDVSTTHHADANGYQLTITWAGGDAVRLQVQGPDYVEPEPQEFVTCDYCHHRYLTNNSMEARIHASEHAWTEQLFDPVPDGHFAERLATDPQAELVDSNTPLWMHEAVLQRAIAFKREFRYDFIQWDGSAKRAAPEGWQGYLFAGHAAGTIVGACAFLVEKSGPYAGQWGLQWIWIAPKFRRHGILKDRWSDFLMRYGDFYIEPPLSDAMQGFVHKHGSDAQKMLLKSPSSS